MRFRRGEKVKTIGFLCRIWVSVGTIEDAKKLLGMTGLITGSFAVCFSWGVIKLSLKAMAMTGLVAGSFAVSFN